ncbi:MAG: AI-2E family transporter [Candidatus Moranbacteria bacterium]|nr:AI-2E family transporter [Candidatus Moranbacteria bacterium]
MEKPHIEISTGFIVKTISIILGLWFLYLVRDVVALFFLSIILTATLGPAIDWMAKRRIPRSLGVIVIYLALILMVGVLISFLIPPLVSQFASFSQNLPAYNESFAKTFSGVEQYALSYGIAFNSHEFFQNITGNFFQSSGQLFSTTVGVFSFFISILVILALTFYMSVKEDGMNKFLVSITPLAHRKYVVSLANRIKSKIGKWMVGQIILMLIIFVLDFIALSIFNVPYALILALLAGLLEIVPYLGPIISATLASIVGFLISPATGIIVLGVLTIIQQMESHIIVPQVMKKAVGLNPVVVILVLLIGAQLGGVLGAILAVPIATSLSVFIGDLVDKNESYV